MDFSKINGNGDLNLKKSLSFQDNKVDEEKELGSVFMNTDADEAVSNKDEISSIFGKHLSSSSDEIADTDVPEIIQKIVDEINGDGEDTDEVENTGINGNTESRIKEERKEKLSEDEAAVYDKFEAYLEAKENGEDVSLAGFVHDLSDDELVSLLSAYDYVNDSDGGMEQLVSDMFGELFQDGVAPEELEVFERLSNLLSEEDKTAIKDYYAKNNNDLINACDGNKELAGGVTYNDLFDYIKLNFGPDKNKMLDLLLDGNIDEALKIYYQHSNDPVIKWPEDPGIEIPTPSKPGGLPSDSTNMMPDIIEPKPQKPGFIHRNLRQDMEF